MAFFQLGLRRAAAHLSRVPAACGPCVRQQWHSKLPAPPSRVLSKLGRASRSYASNSAAPTTEPKTPLEFLSNNVTNAARPTPETTSSQSSGGASSSSFPKTNAKVVGYWLIGSAASVFGIVVFGGLTRLTESGYVL